MFNLEPKRDYKVIGEPEDLSGAIELASHNRYQFQWWILAFIDFRPYGDKKKGIDTGIDGYSYFMEGKNEYKKVIAQVKSGHVSVKDIRDLGHVIDREDAAIGILITLKQPTREMIKEAAGKGFFKSKVSHKDYARIQILTIEDILNGKRPDVPIQFSLASHKKAESVKPESERLGY